MKKFFTSAMLLVSAFTAAPIPPNMLSVSALAVLPQYSLLTVGNISQLKAISLTVISTSTMAMVLGYYDPGDRGGGTFINPAGNLGAGRWIRALGAEAANVRMWGARGNWENNPTPADDTKAIQA